MSSIHFLNRAFDAVIENNNDSESDEEKTDTEKEDEKEKGGGKRKRRSAYSSGRKEAMGLTNGQLYDSPDIGSSDRDNKKRTISRTNAASSHRWRKR